MPICPRCSATIHAGAEDQCPACGYSLLSANESFGEDLREFTRVLDEAGALTHPERMELLRTLEDLERRIPPVALGIYITDDGQVQDLRTHAHWILNHARIHRPSFGKREQSKYFGMLPDGAELREGEPDRERSLLAEPTPSLFTRLWDSISSRLRDMVHPYAPPVRQEWMLILVVDVQLEMACFSWGYMLDPYINPDSINSCIINARLQFRERDMVAGLKKVMRGAVWRIAADARRVNRRLKHRMQQPLRTLMTAALALGLLAAPADAATTKATAKPATKATTTKTAAKTKTTATAKPAAKMTAKPATTKTAAKSPAKPSAKPAAKPTATAKKTTAPRTAEKPKTAVKSEKPATPKTATPAATKQAAPAPKKPELADDDTAEEVDDDTAEEVSPEEATPKPAEPEKAAEPPAAEQEEGDAASFSGAPRWKREHYRLLMAGELETGYAALFPKEVVTPAPKAPEAKGKAKTGDESDTTVQGRYCDAYLHPEPTATLLDPQKLLTSPESDDVDHVLRQLNANAKYRLCVAVFRGSQSIPGELSADTLVSAVAQQVSDRAVLLLYPIGQPDKIDIGYREIAPDDTKRHEWLNAVRTAAAEAGDGADGMMAALRCIHRELEPMSRSFKQLTPDAAQNIPLIPVELTNKEEKEISTREKLRAALEDPANRPYLCALGIPFGLAALFGAWFFWLRRRSATLYPLLQPDTRLNSPYGAGVSRYVKYLEGKEASKEKSLF